MAPRHVFLMLAICLAWAGNIVAIKEAVRDVPPLLAVAIRYAIILPVCLPHMALLSGMPDDGRPPSRMMLVVIAGLIGGAGSFGFGTAAYVFAENLSALAIAGQLGVPFSLILAILFLGERIHWRRTLGIALAFAGVAILAFDPRIVDERIALLLTVAASFTWALSTLLLRRLTGIHVLNLMGWQAVVSLPVLLAASLILEPGALAGVTQIPFSAILWLAYTGLVGSLLGHSGMAWLLQRYPVSVLTPLTLPTPLLSVILATLVYGTPVTPLMALGGILTLSGVAIIALRTAGRQAA
jgi:O-acetylserine/cysteine efflux transporter